jgi:hypothetical protein
VLTADNRQLSMLQVSTGAVPGPECLYIALANVWVVKTQLVNASVVKDPGDTCAAIGMGARHALTLERYLRHRDFTHTLLDGLHSNASLSWSTAALHTTVSVL